jgi:N-acetylglucosaminyldiphosphoundecaprenol N-acetyl-beta-D-mannosaminyltransferase
LLSETQVRRILEAQSTTQRHLRFGEILAQRGWLKSETIDFFAETLPTIGMMPSKIQYKYPLGYYLKSAKLLNDDQIEAILDEQHRTQLRFGEVAVLKGWVKQETINFLLEQLEIHFPQEASLRAGSL